MRFGSWLLVAGIVLVGCTDQPSVSGPSEARVAPLLSAGGPGRSGDRYIVVFRPGITNVDALAHWMTSTYGGQLHHRYRYALQGFSASLPAQALDGIRHNPFVEFVEEDGLVNVTDRQRRPPSWGLDRIDQHDLPVDGGYTYERDGAGVRVYVIDTGVEITHPEFGGRASFGWDFVDNDGDASDCYNHGTHVAGTIAGATVGVAKQASIVAVRVISCQGSGPFSQVIAGIDWVVANHIKPAVVNMSLGGGVSSALDLAAQNAVNAGITVVASAGNSDTDACTQSPARVASLLTVAATTNTDTRAAYSNYGTCVDLFAPGTTIYSSLMGAVYGNRSGTSMAAPHVAGVAALYLSAYPSATPAAVGEAILSGATQGRVLDPGPASPNRLLFSLLPTQGLPPPPGPPTASFEVACQGLTCGFTDRSLGGVGGITSWQWDFGDQGVAATQNPSHTYDAAGSFRVTLEVRDSSGALSTISRDVSVTVPAAVNLPPNVDFAVGCLRLACTFADSSRDQDGTITRREWSFGDGTSSVDPSANVESHAFSAGGVYHVTLTVTDNAGASSTTAKDVAVGVILTAVGAREKGKAVADLSWTGAETSAVDLFVNGSLLATVANTGTYRYRPGPRKGSAAYGFRICESGGTAPNCSREVKLTL